MDNNYVINKIKKSLFDYFYRHHKESVSRKFHIPSQIVKPQIETRLVLSVLNIDNNTSQMNSQLNKNEEEKEESKSLQKEDTLRQKKILKRKTSFIRNSKRTQLAQ